MASPAQRRPTRGKVLAGVFGLLLTFALVAPLWARLLAPLVHSWWGVLAAIVLGLFLVTYALERLLGLDLGLGLGRAKREEGSRGTEGSP